MKTQLILRDGKPEYAVIPYDLFMELIEQAEMLEDIQDYDRVMAALASGEEERIPGEVVDSLLDGENPIKVWREFRGLTQAALAEQAKISTPYLSQLETGKRKGSLDVLSTIARILHVTLDDLVDG